MAKSALDAISAIAYITAKHEGQVDKAGRPYMEHLWGVANVVPGHLILVALGHDLLEDTDATKEDLSKRGFEEWEIETIDLLTTKKVQTRSDYLRAIKKSQDALVVKIADVLNNVSRLHQIEDKETRERLLQKYQSTMELLTLYPKG